MVDRRLEPHDQNQLELKLGYAIDRGRKRQRYLVESWIFVPRTLGLTPSTYPSARFYEDTAAFVRLMTPSVALSALAREGEAVRWFDPLLARLKLLLSGETRVDGTAAHSLKLLGCIYRSSLRDETEHILQRVAQTESSGAEEEARDADIAHVLGTFADDLDAAIVRLRALGERSEHAVMDPSVREVWHAVDEYTALFAEEALTRLVEVLDGRPSAAEEGTDLQRLRRRLADAALALYAHRRARGYPTYVARDSDNEHLPYRRHILKRMVSSALYLDIRHEESGGLVHNMIGMAAAAAAMLFAMLVALWAQLRWDMFSGAFVGVMVISYMIKDRIKEWGKRRLGRSVSRFVPDHVIEIRDVDSGHVVGECRESFAFVSAAKLDAEVRHLRHIDHPTTVATDGRPEVIMRYTKEVTLSSAGLERLISGAEGLNDIIRFNLGRLRERMDGPYESYSHVDPSTRKVVSVQCARVYHVNIVLRFTTGRGRGAVTETERVRVILDQRGIKRVEPISVGARVGAVEHVVEGRLIDSAELA